MTPKPLLFIAAVALGAGTLLTACGSSPQGISKPKSAVNLRTAATSTTTTITPSTTTAPPTSASSTTAAAPPPTPTTVGCAGNTASQLANTGQASQLIVVEASGYATTSAVLTLWQKQGPCWVAAGGPWTATIGANGFSDHHSEGDNTTPSGAYSIGSVMYGNAPNPGVQYSYHQLVCGDWWDEDPSSPAYNTFQEVPCGQSPPFGGGSEALWQETTAYPSFAVVNYNTGPATPNAGSGIFIHADVGGPTAGCISLPLGDLDQLLRWLSPSAAPLVVMGPASEIDNF
jgi:L,D-peptidoglycan transpeptidase YkuD (ErfK/YbiS/YcfS/YnhG family)